MTELGEQDLCTKSWIDVSSMNAVVSFWGKKLNYNKQQFCIFCIHLTGWMTCEGAGLKRLMRNCWRAEKYSITIVSLCLKIFETEWLNLIYIRFKMFSSLRAETDLYSHYEDAFIPSCEKVLTVFVFIYLGQVIMRASVQRAGRIQDSVTAELETSSLIGPLRNKLLNDPKWDDEPVVK